MGVINGFLLGLFTIFGTFFQALTRPLWNLAGQNIPNFVGLMQYILDLLNIIATDIGWVINALGLTPVIHIICLYWLFYIVVGFGAWGIKVVLRWYRILMP